MKLEKLKHIKHSIEFIIIIYSEKRFICKKTYVQSIEKKVATHKRDNLNFCTCF